MRSCRYILYLLRYTYVSFYGKIHIIAADTHNCLKGTLKFRTAIYHSNCSSFLSFGAFEVSDKSLLPIDMRDCETHACMHAYICVQVYQLHQQSSQLSRKSPNFYKSVTSL